MALGLAPAPAARISAPKRRRRWPVLVGFAFVAVVALALTAILEFSGVTLTADPVGLARVDLQALSGTLQPPTAKDAEGRAIALTDARGVLTPSTKIAPGTKVTIVVTARRPGWSAWLLGKTAAKRLTVTAPLAEVTSKWVTKPDGGPVPVTFSEPIARVTSAGHTARATGKSLSVPEKARAGTVKISVAARSWEKLGDPATVHYFPSAKRPVALISPTPSGRLDPGDQVRVTFAGKAAEPKISVAGHWKRPNGHTYVFTPSGSGPSLGSTVKLTLPHTSAVADMRRPQPQEHAHGHVDDPARLAAAPDPAPRRRGLPAGQVRRPGGRAHRARAERRRRAPARGRLRLALREHAVRAQAANGSPRPPTSSSAARS